MKGLTNGLALAGTPPEIRRTSGLDIERGQMTFFSERRPLACGSAGIAGNR